MTTMFRFIPGGPACRNTVMLSAIAQPPNRDTTPHVGVFQETPGYAPELKPDELVEPH